MFIAALVFQLTNKGIFNATHLPKSSHCIGENKCVTLCFDRPRYRVVWKWSESTCGQVDTDKSQHALVKNIGKYGLLLAIPMKQIAHGVIKFNASFGARLEPA